METCWSTEGTTQGGSVLIGTGDSAFSPLPSSMQFAFGAQGGLYLPVRARLWGMEPGSGTDFLNAKNPHTRFSAVMFDGTVVVPPCAITWGYVAGTDGYDLATWTMIEFLPLDLGARAFDTSMTLVVEVVDANHLYARNEGQVIVKAPDGWGSMDAGVR